MNGRPSRWWARAVPAPATSPMTYWKVRPVPEGDHALEVRNLCKEFPMHRGGLLRRQTGALRAVDDVSFSLARGEALGVVGESGCGKSTLARLLLALEKPTAGQVIFGGRNLFELNAQQLRAARRRVQI